MALRPRGAWGMRQLGGLRDAVRDILYGGRCPLGNAARERWMSRVDLLVRQNYLKYDEVKAWASRFVEQFGEFEKPTETNTPQDHMNLERFFAWVREQTLPDLPRRRAEFEAKPGYKPGGGVETIKAGLRDAAYQKQLIGRRRKKEQAERNGGG